MALALFGIERRCRPGSVAAPPRAVLVRTALLLPRQGGARRQRNMDLLVSIGTLAAYLLSLYLWLAAGHGEHLYSSGGVVIALLLAGRWLEARARGRPRKRSACRPAAAGQRRVLRDGAEQQVPLETCCSATAWWRCPASASRWTA